MSVQTNIKRQPVIKRGGLIIDLQCCMVILSGKQITLYQKEFDALYLLTQYPGWVLSLGQIYRIVWIGGMYASMRFVMLSANSRGS